MAAKSTKKKKHIGLGLIFWLVFACAIVIVFLAKKDDMLSIIKQTEFFSHVFGNEPAFIAEHEIIGEDSLSENNTESEQLPSTKAQISSSDTSSPKLEIVVNEEETIDKPSIEENVKSPSTEPNVVASPKVQEPAKTATTTKTETSSTNTMSLHIWFVVIDGDGTIVRKEAVRNLTKSGTPLADSINNLLSGPSAQEEQDGYTSLIPTGTKLLSASVRDKVATLNFSDNFMYNTYGIEGYLGQLMQIVYTATAFPTIDSVQFIIDGEKLEFLGEGVRIGVPLSRSSFK